MRIFTLKKAKIQAKCKIYPKKTKIQAKCKFLSLKSKKFKLNVNFALKKRKNENKKSKGLKTLCLKAHLEKMRLNLASSK